MKVNPDQILISGAGPAGAFASMYLSYYQIPHTLVDKSHFPRDKICGDAISGKVINLLANFDESLVKELSDSSQAFTTNGIYFFSPSGKKIELPFPQASGKYPPGFVQKRVSFDNFLVNQIDEDYCRFIGGTRINGLQNSPEGNLVELKDGKQSYKINPDLIIGADGAQSVIRRSLFPDNSKINKSAGLRLYARNVEPAPNSSYIELHFLKNVMPGYFWIFPLGNGDYNIGLGMHEKRVKKHKINLKNLLKEVLEKHPEVSGRFTNFSEEDQIRGWSLPMYGRNMQMTRNGVMLTGDAANLIDPFTGEGIAPAMLSGKLAALKAMEGLKAERFDHKFLKSYEDELFSKIKDEMRISYWLQQITFYPRLLQFMMDKVSHSKEFQNSLYRMFTDMEERKKILNPLKYVKFLTKH